MERAIRRHDLITGLGTVLLILGPLVPLQIIGPVVNGEIAIVGTPKVICALTIFVGPSIWMIFRRWQFGRKWCCPVCTGRLKNVRGRSQRKNYLLGCSTCAINWDTGLAYPEPRTDSGG
jgi:hypothetical protein